MRSSGSRDEPHERRGKITARPLPIKLARLAGALFALCALGADAVTLDDARALLEAGRVEEAVAAYRAIAEAAESPEDAGTARNNACVLLMDLGDYNGALAECLEARRLREDGADRRVYARTLNNTGLALQRLGRHPEAESAYREALAINRERGDTEAVAINLRNLALLYSLEGHYARARDQLAEVLRLVAEHASEDWAAEQRRLATINLGVILEQLGAYDEALARYRELLADADVLEPRHGAALQINVGVVYRNLGDPIRALEAFRAGVAAYESLGDVASLSNAWVNIGLVHHLNLHEPKEAESAYRKALALAQESGDREEEAWDRVYLGRLLLEDGRIDEAAQALDDALRVATEAESAEAQWTALESLGRVAVARGQEDVALEKLLAAIGVIEAVRIEAGEEHRAGFFADKRAVYGAAIAVLARLDAAQPDPGHDAHALELAQRAKARELIDALGLGAQPAEPLDAARLRATVGEGELVLEYFAGEGRLYRWTIGANAIALRDLGPADAIRAAVGSVHAALAQGAAPAGSDLAQLSGVLLADLDLKSTRTLYIAPDGVLQYLPFELLSPSGGDSLLRTATVSYLPSASALTWLRTRSVEPALELLAFGDVPAPEAADPGSAAAQLLAGFELAPLTQTAREIGAAQRYLPGRRHVLIGPAASEAAWHDSAQQPVAVVHLATHALVDERPGGGAAILLAAGPDEDGLLRPDEIIAEPHPASLTVLAACRSAADALESGRTLRSLTGAFLASGSKAVIATLWEVDDATTAAFMEQLYYEIGKGAAASEALRRVKLRLREDAAWKNPALWSGYVLIGESETPLVRRTIPVRALAIGGAGVLVAGLVAWLVLRRRFGAGSEPDASRL
jgi:tetratricopeptide (TPR) repeat protein